MGKGILPNLELTPAEVPPFIESVLRSKILARSSPREGGWGFIQEGVRFPPVDKTFPKRGGRIIIKTGLEKPPPRGDFNSAKEYSTALFSLSTSTLSPSMNMFLSSSYSKKENDIMENEEEESLAPTNPTEKQGIEWSDNSCYLDAALFCMFYSTKIFDSYLLDLKSCKNPEDDGAKGTSSSLREVVSRLRESGFCPSSETSKLRNIIASASDNPKLKSSMMDVDDFLRCLLDRSLKLKHFIHYSLGPSFSNFFHYLLLMKQTEDSAPFHQVKNILKESMAFQKLKFAEIPIPALILKMPVSGEERLLKRILPNLTIDIGNLMGSPNEMDTKMHLLAVITYKAKHFTSFVRKWSIECSDSDPWAFFDSLTCKIVSFDNLSKHLKNLESKEELFKNDLEYYFSKELRTIMEECFICIYFSPSAIKADSKTITATVSFP